jgi:S1-C subfamily serine protease
MKFLRSPFVAAIVGGAVVAAVFLIAGIGNTNKTTTVIDQESSAGAAASPQTSGSPSNVAATSTNTTAQALTAHQIYEQDAPGVVYIRSTLVQQQQSPFNLFGGGGSGGNGSGSQSSLASGSGIVVDKNGTILTNWHVVQGAAKVTVQFGTGNQVQAKVIGSDPSDDLALLRIPTDGLNLTPLPLGDSSRVQVGDPTLAIGNPFGLERTLTTGVVSALQRSITAPNGFTIDNVIQTDAPINPGNSGGPLLNAQGQVIGVNSQIETGGSGDGSVGIGFAVPINTAKAVIPQLEKTGKIQQAYLGLVTTTIDGTLSSLHVPASSGALVQTVQTGTPASKAGIKGGDVQSSLDGQPIELGGDIIVAVDGQKIATSDDLATVIGSKKPGQTVTVTVLRGPKAQKVNVKVTLGTRPNSVPNQTTPRG